MRTLPPVALLASLVLTGCPEDPSAPAKAAWSEAFPANDLGWLLAAWGPSATDVYAIGGAPDAGLLMHFDGQRWSKKELGVTAPLLDWGFGFGPTDITFVGEAGTILHYDGAGFTKSATVTDQPLWGVWGASPTDLWAVGGDGFSAGHATILRFDGRTWTTVEVPALQHPDVFAFYKVWGSAADDVYIVGQRGAVVHWDGRALEEVLVGSSEDLVTVFGIGRDRIAIVGGRSNGELVTWDGTRWQRDTLAPLPGLNGVWFRDPNTLHVCGQDGTIATIDWATRAKTVESSGTRLDLHALFGDASGHLLAVGGSLASTEAPFRGVALGRTLSAGER